VEHVHRQSVYVADTQTRRDERGRLISPSILPERGMLASMAYAIRCMPQVNPSSMQHIESRRLMRHQDYYVGNQAISNAGTCMQAGAIVRM
jgi:hypothetical protein